ncbi:hypothetical protein D3C75_1030060 [compost metagenome]
MFLSKLDFLCEHAVLPAAMPLGLIKRQIGVLQQLLRARAVRPGLANPDTGRHGKRLLHINKRLFQTLNNGFAGLFGDFLVSSFEQQREFISAQSGYDAGRCGTPRQHISDMLKQQVADMMSPGIVQVFEIIEINMDQTDGLSVLLSRPQQIR